MLCVPIFRQIGQLWIFGPKFAQKWILGLEFQKSKSGFGINTSKISSFNGVKYVMSGHIFVIQKFSSFLKLMEHSVELFLAVWQWNNKSKVFFIFLKKVLPLFLFYILKVHLTYLNKPSRVWAKNEIFDRYFSKILLKFYYKILAEQFWMTLFESPV